MKNQLRIQIKARAEANKNQQANAAKQYVARRRVVEDRWIREFPEARKWKGSG
jgi:hypothetical protein